MKPEIMIIIMIHSELHIHFSLINVTASLSFFKATGLSINFTVHMNNFPRQCNFFVDITHTHLQALWDTQAVHTSKTNPRIHSKDEDVMISFADTSSRPLGHTSHIHSENESSGRARMQQYLYHNILSSWK